MLKKLIQAAIITFLLNLVASLRSSDNIKPAASSSSTAVRLLVSFR